MHTRLIILTVVIVSAVCGLGGLGYHAIDKWAQGLEGTRLGEFAEVAEQVRQDVKRKLDEFIRAEQQRKYTDYLYYYVPENALGNQGQWPLLRSPLGGQLSNNFAYGYFQIEPDGGIVTPYAQSQPSLPNEQDKLALEARQHTMNVRQNVLPAISSTSGALRLRGEADRSVPQEQAQSLSPTKKVADGRMAEAAGSNFNAPRSKAFPIESLKQEAQQAQVFTQQRAMVTSNQTQMAPIPAPQTAPNMPVEPPVQAPNPPVEWWRAHPPTGTPGTVQRQAESQGAAVASSPQENEQDLSFAFNVPQGGSSDLVQIRVEPFVPLVVPDNSGAASIFGGQVFLLRHVQIEDKHFLQGFQLDEQRLVAEVGESARRFMREGMEFELPQVSRARAPAFEGGTPSTPRGQDAHDAAYTAILDFGFGNLILSLKEIDPAWIMKRISGLHQIYFGIIATVVAAVALALGSLWHNVRAQVILAQKKDDFISAVSHELRTPLTSIRMYAEMLEKNWVKSADKLSDYYRTLRQESERLSRLVENVLDFARLQRGRKRYAFELGDVNTCIAGVIAMMKPYAEQHGFTVQAYLGPVGEMSFDKDAVTQIVVNLIDNAVKYARGATDKTILVSTRSEDGYTIVEVEDHGPGIPHRQQKRVFEPFYRCEDRRPNAAAIAGTGLGLTLVKRFAEAHGGYVQIRCAEPTGAILRVGLATRSSQGERPRSPDEF